MTVVLSDSIQAKPLPIANAIIPMAVTPLVKTKGNLKFFPGCTPTISADVLLDATRAMVAGSETNFDSESWSLMKPPKTLFGCSAAHL